MPLYCSICGNHVITEWSNGHRYLFHENRLLDRKHAPELKGDSNPEPINLNPLEAHNKRVRESNFKPLSIEKRLENMQKELDIIAVRLDRMETMLEGIHGEITKEPVKL